MSRGPKVPRSVAPCSMNMGTLLLTERPRWGRTYPGDEVVLQVEDLELSAPLLQVFNPLDVLLMEGQFLQGEDLPLVVLRPPSHHVLRDCQIERTDTRTRWSGRWPFTDDWFIDTLIHIHWWLIHWYIDTNPLMIDSLIHWYTSTDDWSIDTLIHIHWWLIHWYIDAHSLMIERSRSSVS